MKLLLVIQKGWNGSVKKKIKPKNLKKSQFNGRSEVSDEAGAELWLVRTQQLSPSPALEWPGSNWCSYSKEQCKLLSEPNF